MRKKKQIISQNYLEKIPKRPDNISWSVEDSRVILHLENKGIFNKIAQILFKKPKTSHVHLDEIGSFLWPLLDGNKNILELGKSVENHFGEKAHPLYERLAKYFQILDSYHFVEWK